MSTHPASIGQASLWFLRQMMPYKSPYNIAVRFRLSGELDANAVVEALREIVRRHESCRTTFAVVDGNVVQIIHSDMPADVSIVDFSAAADPEGQTERLEYSIASETFDLETGPLIRARVLCIGPRDHSLVVVMDHIVADGMSLGVIWRELEALYPAMRVGAPSPLPPLAKQYLACVEAQNRWLQTPTFARQLNFWKDHLAGAVPSDLPTDRSRPPIKSYRGNLIHSRIPRLVCDRIRALAATENTSVFMVMLAALEILLARISGQSDIAIVVPVDCRNRFNAMEVIGYFANAIVLRNDVPDDLPFHDLLKNVRTEVMVGLLRKDVPFKQVIEKIQPERSLSHDPLSSVAFSFLPARGSNSELPGVNATYREISNGGAKFDLHFYTTEIGEEMSFTAEYNTDIFDQATIERFVEHNLVLLQSVVADPGATVAALPILSPAERQRLLVDYNATAAPYPHATIVDLVRTTAVRVPNRAAATFETTTLSYAELERRSNQVARCLLARGVGPGALVGIAVERSLGILVGMLGILKTGAAYVPLDPMYPRERLAFIAEDSGLRTLVTEESLADVVPHATVLRLDTDAAEIEAQSGAPLEFALDPASIAYVIYTSGSTGRPKGVQIPHRALVNFLVTMAQQPGLSESDRLLAVTSLSFDIAGLELWLPLIVGAKIDIASRETSTDGLALRARVQSGQITVLQATPSTFRMMIEAGWTGSPNLKILVGGEAISRELADLLLDRAATVWNMYGPTETTIWSTIHPLRKDQPILIGRPIANTQIYILDRNLQPVPIGTVGEIFIGGDGVAEGYLNRPELNRQRFLSNPFGPRRIYRTGDLGRFHPDGTIEYLGRNDFQVKVRGFRIELGEIETTITSHPAVRQTVVVAREVAAGDQRLVAYLTAREQPPSPNELRAHVRSRLPAYMVPAAFVLLESLPLTPNGKIDRKALPAPDTTCLDPTLSGDVAPRNTTEQRLAAIFAEVLKLPSVSRNDNFFDLGGHSLMAVKLMMSIEREFGIRMPLSSLFQGASVAMLAAALGNYADKDGRWHSLVPINVHDDGPALFLVHGAGGNVLLYRQLARALAPDISVYGFQSQGLDGYAAPLKRVEDMAAHYVRELREFQPSGPYHIGGYCMGGSVAYEMARLLQKEGQTVGVVALLDTYNFSIARRFNTGGRTLAFISQKLGFHLDNLRLLGPKALFGYLLEKLRMADESARGKIAARLKIMKEAVSGAVEEPGAEVFIQKINHEAGWEFLPQPFLGRITVFRPQKNYDFFPDPKMGWSDLVARGLEIVELPVNPHAMLIEPFAARLALELKKRIQAPAPRHPARTAETQPATAGTSR